VTKVGSNGDEETWILKTYFSTEETFPTVLRRSEIVLIQTTEISPIENALADVEAKTKELALLHVKYSSLAKTGQAVSANKLSTALHGVVDPPPNSGAPFYRKAFLSHDYKDYNDDRIEFVQKLRDAIDEQARNTLLQCLSVAHPIFNRSK
jgi:hypothetical protein